MIDVMFCLCIYRLCVGFFLYLICKVKGYFLMICWVIWYLMYDCYIVDVIIIYCGFLGLYCKILL